MRCPYKGHKTEPMGYRIRMKEQIKWKGSLRKTVLSLIVSVADESETVRFNHEVALKGPILVLIVTRTQSQTIINLNCNKKGPYKGTKRAPWVSGGIIKTVINLIMRRDKTKKNLGVYA